MTKTQANVAIMMLMSLWGFTMSFVYADSWIGWIFIAVHILMPACAVAYIFRWRVAIVIDWVADRAGWG